MKYSRKLVLTAEEKRETRIKKSEEKKENIYSNYSNIYRVIENDYRGFSDKEIKDLKRQIKNELITNTIKFGSKCIRIKIKIAGSYRWVFYPISSQSKDNILNNLIARIGIRALKPLYDHLKTNNIYWRGFTRETKLFYENNKHQVSSIESNNQNNQLLIVNNNLNSYNSIKIDNIINIGPVYSSSICSSGFGINSDNSIGSSVDRSIDNNKIYEDSIIVAQTMKKKKSLFLINNNNSNLLKSISNNSKYNNINNNKKIFNNNNNHHDNQNIKIKNSNKTIAIQPNNPYDIKFLNKIYSTVHTITPASTLSDIDEPQPPPVISGSNRFSQLLSSGVHMVSSIFKLFK